MIPCKRQAALPPRVWIVAVDGRTARAFAKTGRSAPRFGEMFRAPLKDAGAKLAASLQSQAYDRLVLAGSRGALGLLYARLEKPVRARVAAEVHRALGRMEEEALQKQLARIVWF